MIRTRKSRDGKTVRYIPEVWNPRTGRREGARKILGIHAKGTYDTRREAKRVERQMEEAVEAPLVELGPTVAEWVERWLTEYRRPKASTNRVNRSALKSLVTEHGDVLLKDFTRDMARAFGTARPGSARIAQACWNDALYEAELECVAKNPWTRLKLPAAGRRRLALTEAEVYELADLAPRVLGGYGTVMRAMIIFSAYTGLRVGELCAMRHDWIDGDTLTVSANLQLGTGVEVVPKNGDAADCAILPPAMEALRSIPRTMGPYVWTLPTGARLEHNAHAYHWQKVRAAFLARDRDARRQEQVDGLVWHSLRHTCATLLAERGFSRWEIMLQLRHKSPEMVDNVYTHISERAARRRLVDEFHERVGSADPGGTMEAQN